MNVRLISVWVLNVTGKEVAGSPVFSDRRKVCHMSATKVMSPKNPEWQRNIFRFSSM